MKKLIILTIILLFAAPVHGADADPEMQKLQSVVANLRKGGEKAFRNAVSKLSSDKLWTPMDELRINRNAECRISDGVAGFRLNAVMTNAENAERYQTTTGLYLNGADMRYNYSLVEKTIKAKKSVTYNLPGRWGLQTFIVMPYGGEKARLKVLVVNEGQKFSVRELLDGEVCITGVALKDKPLLLKIGNNSDEPVSYVIINHNTRK